MRGIFEFAAASPAGSPVGPLPPPGPMVTGPPAGMAGRGMTLRPLVVRRYAFPAAASTAIRRPATLTRVVPAWVESGPSSALMDAMTPPFAAFTSSIVGGVVTAAVALVRGGCTNRANMVAFTGVTAEMARGTVVVPDVTVPALDVWVMA